MQEFSERLDGRDHAGHEVVTAQVAPDFFLDAGPGEVSEFSRQVAVEAGVRSQPFGNRQHDLAVRDRGTNFFGHMQCGQPIILAGRGGGTINTGRHIHYEKGSPLANLYLSMLDRVGAPTDQLGNSTDRLVELAG